jgi:hypothetical protein
VVSSWQDLSPATPVISRNDDNQVHCVELAASDELHSTGPLAGAFQYTFTALVRTLTRLRTRLAATNEWQVAANLWSINRINLLGDFPATSRTDNIHTAHRSHSTYVWDS